MFSHTDMVRKDVKRVVAQSSFNKSTLTRKVSNNGTTFKFRRLCSSIQLLKRCKNEQKIKMHSLVELYSTKNVSLSNYHVISDCNKTNFLHNIDYDNKCNNRQMVEESTFDFLRINMLMQEENSLTIKMQFYYFSLLVKCIKYEIIQNLILVRTCDNCSCLLCNNIFN